MITNKKNKKNLLGILLVTGVLVISLCYIVSGLGLSTLYSESYPFVIGPGETKNLEITLSSLEATKATVNLTSDSGIATIIDTNDEYDVANSANINLKIEIPADTPEGTEYTVALRAKTITPPEGMISTVSETGTSFKVLVQKPAPPAATETPAPETPINEGISPIWWILGIIVVIAIIAIIWFVVKSRKE